jgi:DNA polymerase V
MSEVTLFTPQSATECKIPLFTMPVAAGYPHTVEDDIEQEIDLNEYLIEHPQSTFFAQVRNPSASDSIFSNGDILIVDSGRTAKDLDYVIAEMGNERSVKIYRNGDGGEFLQNYEGTTLPLKIEPYMEFRILGVVTKQIHAVG